MGVNRAGFSIFDDEVVKRAAEHEVIRRYFIALSATIKRARSAKIPCCVPSF